MNERLLISNVLSIVKAHELIKERTGGYFNIFRIAKIDQMEVTVCRVIHDLLDPKGSHGQGDLFLKEFVSGVLALEFSESDYKSVQVYREYLIEKNRRIDLLIKTINYEIPIEVKIRAVDQGSQCADYFQYARNSKLIYVTKYGTEPSLESLGSLSVNNILCVSFKEQIISWLESCLSLIPVLKIAPIREVLIQFIDVMKSFTNQMGDEQMDEIEQLLSANSENMKSALLIEQGINKSRVALLKKLFHAFENAIDKEKIKNYKDYEFNDYMNLNRYYVPNGKNKEFPGLHYLYKEDVVDGCDLWFSIEIHNYLYAGFYLNGEKGKDYLTIQQIGEILPHIQDFNREDLFLHWRYLPLLNEDKGPNFAEASFEDNYLNLFDDEYFNQFVDECLKDIEQLYGQPLLKTT